MGWKRAIITVVDSDFLLKAPTIEENCFPGCFPVCAHKQHFVGETFFVCEKQKMLFRNILFLQHVACMCKQGNGKGRPRETTEKI